MKGDHVRIWERGNGFKPSPMNCVLFNILNCRKIGQNSMQTPEIQTTPTFFLLRLGRRHRNLNPPIQEVEYQNKIILPYRLAQAYHNKRFNRQIVLPDLLSLRSQAFLQELRSRWSLGFYRSSLSKDLCSASEDYRPGNSLALRWPKQQYKYAIVNLLLLCYCCFVLYFRFIQNSVCQLVGWLVVVVSASCASSTTTSTTTIYYLLLLILLLHHHHHNHHHHHHHHHYSH